MGDNSASNEILSREDRTKKEIRRLNSILRDLDGNKKKAAKSLIENAAFMSVALEDLQEIISESGYAEEYQNGQNQSGTKETAEVKTYHTLTKNHAMVMKMLLDLTPPARAKKSKLQALREDE